MSDTPQPGTRVIVALDYADVGTALEFVSRIGPEQCRLKVGKELFTVAGPDFVRRLAGQGFDVFLDLKYHDIPHTTARACRAAAGLGVWMLNVHALGGRRMLEAAAEAISAIDKPPLLVAVTILTSMDAAELKSIGLGGTPAEHVVQLATLASDCELDGVVCSSREAPQLRAQLGAAFQLITPGIRPAGSPADDQRRVMTPVDAVCNGSDYLVIGRPVTQSDDPSAVLLTINSELDALH